MKDFAEKTFPLIGNILIPAFIFALGLVSFYAFGNIAVSSQLVLHSSFYLISFAGFLTLLYYNRSRPVFFILLIVLSYMLINYLKNINGSSYINSPYYLNLCFFIPLNLVFFYFFSDKKLLQKFNVWLLLTIFAEFAIAEKLGQSGIGLGLNLLGNPPSPLNNLSGLLFMGALVIFFSKATYSGTIFDYSLFFAALNVFFGFYYSDSSTALTIFFSAAALTLIIAIIQNLYYTTYKDALTGLDSRNSFILHSPKFPLKYSLGIICIDDYDKLSKMFGRRGRDNLSLMVSNLITELEGTEAIYRYSEDEFVIIFKNEGKKESFERMENIRRAIASSSFILNNRKRTIKLTVSGSVSEKKRSDANAFEVLVRARKVLQKTLSFSHNVTSQA